MKILLAYKAHAAGSRDPHTSLLPIGLGYINAVLRKKGFRSRLANLSGFSWQEAARFIAAEKPSVFGISQFTHNRFESLKLARLVKEQCPDCCIVMGGPHASHRYRQLLSQNRCVDIVVIGEGEKTFSQLIGSLAAGGDTRLGAIKGIAFREGTGITVTAPQPPITVLDDLPFPAACFDDAIGVAPRQQLEYIITSRGCPASCSFCSSPLFWGKGLRFRSPRSIVDEIRYVRDRYGLIYFSIRDDTFTADRERVLEFCRLLLEEKVYILWNCQSRVNAVDDEILAWMKRAGCECVQFGVESGSMRVLGTLGKRITPEQIRKAAAATRRAGINLSVYLMTGIPGETDRDLEKTVELLDGIGAHDGQVSPLAWYPGTRIFAEGVKEGTVGAGLFEESREAALYVRTDPFVARSTRLLLDGIARNAEANSFTGEDFRAQKRYLGYCHATNVMAGEIYESRGRWQPAEAEYREITGREPENPWGWLLLGELLAGRGNVREAQHAFESLVAIVPAHAPGYAALGDLCRERGDLAAARKQYRKALGLDPHDARAAEGLDAVDGKKRRNR